MNVFVKRYWAQAHNEYHAWPLWSQVTNSSGVTYKYLYWPIDVKWSHKYGNWRVWFTWHGWQLLHKHGDDPNVIRYGWTYHLGPIKVFFGP